MKKKAALINGGHRSRFSRLALVAGAVAPVLVSQANAAVTITEITDAITEASTVLGTIGAAGFGVLGIFVVYKIARRGVSKLT